VRLQSDRWRKRLADIQTTRAHLIGITRNAIIACMVEAARNLTMAEIGWLTQVGLAN
jgi:hypothetical protein